LTLLPMSSGSYMPSPLRFESIFCRLVTEATAASHEVGRASECYEHRGCKAVRVTPHPPWPCCFQLTFAGLHLAAGPRFLAKTGSSSRALLLLYRVLTDSDPPEPFRVRAPSLGFSSQSRRQHRESTCGELPTAHLCSALSVSHALDGLLLSLPCGLVSSHCHVRDSLYRGFPRNQATATRHRGVPSCR
jgi:hypothetical protein